MKMFTTENMKHKIKNSLKSLDNTLGIRAWLSSEPRQAIMCQDFLRGEKDLDYGWVAANARHGIGKALDVGCINSPVSPILATFGYDVIGIDLRPDIHYELKNFQFIRGDFLDMSFPKHFFDVVVLCSTVEHIGLTGRYGNKDVLDGDLIAMKKVLDILKSDGICILTIPVGIGGIFKPWHIVYGENRFSKLVSGFKITKSRYFVKEVRGKWYETNQEMAFDFQGDETKYAIGQYVLVPDDLNASN